MKRMTPFQLVDTRFKTAPPAPSSKVQRAASPRDNPPSEAGAKPFATSQASGNPSLSVSALRGFEPAACSCTFVRPSPSMSPAASSASGFKLLASSHESVIPSSSVSAFSGSVPSVYSCRLVRPSPSASCAPASSGFNGSRMSEWRNSNTSSMPSPSESAGWLTGREMIR